MAKARLALYDSFASFGISYKVGKKLAGPRTAVSGQGRSGERRVHAEALVAERGAIIRGKPCGAAVGG